MSFGLLRTEAVRILADARGDMLSVVTMQAVAPWNACGQADDRNFNVTGCMGSAASIGLGLALARPDDRVLVLDGDGSLLMQLGSLVSVAEQQPPNLYHVVFENGIYETSGGQSVPGREVSDLATIALASGYRHVQKFTSAAELAEGVGACLHRRGPVFVSLAITGPGVLDKNGGHPPPANKPTQIENMRLALTAGR
jgi:thiamine pyrophosphate-dependent acetolactate synthase large subunit-like protein